MTENPEPVTVVVADDQSAVRQGLVLLLGTVPGIAVTGEAEDGEAAVEMVAAKNPQVVLMDLNMPRCDGVEATRRIRASHPQTQVVVLTTYSDDESIIGALQAGALGYLTKDATRAEIGRAVLAAAAGQAVLDPEVQQRLLSAAARAPAAAGTADPADTDLTPRESDVLRLIAAGKSNREIARALFVSEATVKTHVNRIFAKTGSRDRTQAMRYAYTHGYADPADQRLRCHSGSWRCISPGSLSIRSPRQLGWRKIPSVVHSANATSPTSRGSACWAGTFVPNGLSSRPSDPSCPIRSVSMSWVKPVPTCVPADIGDRTQPVPLELPAVALLIGRQLAAQARQHRPDQCRLERARHTRHRYAIRRRFRGNAGWPSAGRVTSVAQASRAALTRPRSSSSAIAAASCGRSLMVPLPVRSSG